MDPIKHGDTDGYVEITVKSNGVVHDLTGKTVDIYFNCPCKNVFYKVENLTVSSPTGGVVQWQPTDADYEVLVPADYSVELVARSGTANKTIPTVMYDTLRIYSTLPRSEE